MRKRSSSSGSRKSSAKRRPDNFDEFGFAWSKGKKIHRCHDYSYPQLSATRVKDLCELLSFWNGSSFICRSQMERFIRMGVPPVLRGRVWKCLLNIDSLRDSSAFNYQRCLTEIRGPLVDLGVSEYSILSAIATLNDTENTLGAYQNGPSLPPDSTFSSADVTVFRQVALDLQRSFPTHRSLMGESPEAVEGQAKLFRVLTAYAKYNPKIGYAQGMSYIAAVLLMHLSEEEAFWALVALLEQPKYLAQLFDLSLNKIQHQVKVFHQLLKHRKPQLSRHMEDVGISPVHFAMPWFLTLFTSLPCWDSVLAVWDLVMLHGLSAVFRAGLTILQLLEPRLLALGDEAAALPLLLRVPVDVSLYSVLVPALWRTELQDWEITCMTGLVLEEAHTGQDPDTCDSAPSQALLEKRGQKEEGMEEEKENEPAKAEKEKENEKEEKENEKENEPAKAEEEEKEPAKSEKEKALKKDSSVSGAGAAFRRVLRVAQLYFKHSGRHSRPGTPQPGTPQPSSPQPSSPQPSTTSSAPGGTPSEAFTLPQSKIKGKRRSLRGRPHVVGGTSVKGPSPPDAPAQGEENRREPTFQRKGTGPASRGARRRGSNLQPVRVKSVRLQRPGKASNTPPPLSSPLTSDPPQAHLPSHRALLRELSTKCQEMQDARSPPKTVQASHSPPKTFQASHSPPKTFQASHSPPKTVQASQSPPKTVQASHSPPKTFQASHRPPKTVHEAHSPPKTVQASHSPPKTFQASHRPPKTVQEAHSPPKTVQEAHSPPKTFQEAHSPPKTVQEAHSPPKTVQEAHSPPKTVQASHSPPKTVQEAHSPPKTVLEAHSPPKTVQASHSPPKTVQASHSPPKTVQEAHSPPKTVQEAHSPPKAVQEAHSPPKTVQEAHSPPKTVQEAHSPPKTFQEAHSLPKTVHEAHSPPKTVQEAHSPPKTFQEAHSLPKTVHEAHSPPKTVHEAHSPPKTVQEAHSLPKTVLESKLI